MGLFNFFNKVNQGSKTVLLLQELLLPEFEKHMMCPSGEEAVELVRSLYKEALEANDFNALKLEGKEWTGAGICLSYGLNRLSKSRSGRPIAYALSSALFEVTSQLEWQNFDPDYVSRFKAVEREFRQVVDLGIDGFTKQ